MPKLVTFGRIPLPTMFDDLSEQIGDSIGTAGGAVVPGERRARPFSVQIPLHADPTEASTIGNRMRRQVRSLIDNSQACIQGIYYQFSSDTELNGWLVPGGGEIQYAEGGITFSDFKFALSECYKVGNLNQHRWARRVEAFDRRLGTTARDIKQTQYSTAFSTISSATPFTALPPAGDWVAADGHPLAVSTINTIDGVNVSYVTGRPHGDVIHFDMPEANFGKTDVIALDRRGITAPTFSLAGDAAPQATYGWEEVYGPNYPFSTNDTPVLQNGICRVMWVGATTSLRFDQYVPATGYVERGRFTFYQYNGVSPTRYQTLISASLVSWTPERSVMRIVLNTASVLERAEIFVTLQRGWQAPRVELYSTWTSAGVPGAEIRYHPNTSATISSFTAGLNSTAVGAGYTYGTSGSTTPTTDRPKFLVQWTAASAFNVAGAVVRHNVVLNTRSDSAAYGAARDGFGVLATDGTAQEGYVSVWLGQIGATTEAAAATHSDWMLYESRYVPELVAR